MTVAITYEQLVGQTFRDNAIRSVMMIDDQFIPYPNLIDLISNKEEVNEQLLTTSKRAANLESFFQKQKILCDIDNSSSNIDIDRIRKSDLLIIDYHLEHENPKKTLEILCGLKNSKHFNLAVVYTSNNLDQVWLEIATSFIETKNVNLQIEEIDDLDEFWSETILPSIEAGSEYSLTNQDLIAYLRTGKLKGSIKQILSKSEFKDNKDQIVKIIHDYYIDKNQIIKLKTNNELQILGDINGNKWIKSGNIFVCLYQKSIDNIEEDPKNIWETLQSSLVDWKPSYYQLIQSEIQNHIESDSMAFNSVHDNDKHGQAAWLQEILKSNSSAEYTQLIRSINSDISEELSLKFNKNEELGSFLESTFQYYKDDFMARPNTDPIKFCADILGLPFDRNKTSKDMYHALNMHLSSKNYQNEYISTGTIFKTVISPYNTTDTPDTWYLCVSAACDMIPNQANDPYNERLTPHRFIRVLKLFPTNQDLAIKNATHSKYIYVYDNNERKYFSILNDSSNLPSIDYMAIKDHVTQFSRSYVPLTRLRNHDGHIEMEDILVKLKSQLRVGYAERYQSIASQHSARIGVDYINL